MTSTGPASHVPPSKAAPDRREKLLASLVHDAFQFVVAIRSDFTVEFISDPVTALTGLHPADLVEASVADFVHPEDLERALLHLAGWERFGAPGGTTNFRIRHADGAWVGFDVTAAQVSDGVQDYLAVYCTPSDYQHATDEVLARLLDGADRSSALAPVLDVFAWHLNDSSVAIAWDDPDIGRTSVSTGLPDELTGVAEVPDSPWERVRTTGEPFLDIDQSSFSPQLASLARAHGRGGLWVVPIEDAGSDQPALVSIWVRSDGPRPDGHSYGMSIARTYVELILRWASQVTLLQRAARHDQLTGLANRRALFDALQLGESRGALLFCDLDHFKPVNDAHGHAAGDAVLRQIAHRIEDATRSTDLVARTGGDEFVVLAPGLTLEQAAALAQRIRSAVAQPLEVGDAEVHVGVTIGIAYADQAISEMTLGGADQALMHAKAQARGTVRWAPGPMPDDEIARQNRT